MTLLVIQAQRGDQAAMNDLIGGCYGQLYAAAYQTVKNQDTACDVTQEACLEIINSLQKLENPEAFMVWAQRITYHQCTRYFRQNKELLVDENEDGETVFDILPDESDSAQIDQAYETKEFQQEMMAIIDTLPPEQRSALLLHYYERLSVKQIAEIQETTEGTVKSRLNYGRKAVKKQVEAYEKKNNIKLHSVAPLGLLLWWLFGREKETASVTLQAMPKVAQALGASAGKTAAAAGGAAARTVLSKVAAGIAAAVLATGAVGGSIALMAQPESEPTTAPSVFATIHIHNLKGSLEHNKLQHWILCDCGEKLEAEPHQFEDNHCSCGQYQDSEGLSIHTYDGLGYIYSMGNCTDTTVVIPESIDGVPVVGIEPRAFWQNAEIHTVILPGSLQFMENHIFAYSNIQEAIFLPGVRQIGTCAFYGCQQLTTVTIPATVELIGEDAFYDCPLLSRIYYDGTMAQWRAIMSIAGNYTVCCSDGIIEAMGS